MPRGTPLIAQVLFLGLLTAAIFVVDTATHREIAAAVFYAVVILLAARVIGRHALRCLALTCVLLAVLSLVLTPHGQLQAGLINLGISITAIVLTTHLIVKIDAARAAAQTAQHQLMRLARVHSLEGLTTSIAHEINQPLAAITTSGDACRRWLAQTPPNVDRAAQAVQRMLDAAGRASSIIARVRSLTRGEPPQCTAFDLNAALREVVDLSSAELARQHIVCSFELADRLPPAWADRVQIQQVMSNLLLNAMEAVGLPDIATREICFRSVLEQSTLRMSLSDTGPGIPPGTGEQLFDAFWTTKAKGMGVGLSISRAIIEANRGTLGVEPREAGGAVFSFSVPVAGDQDEALR